MLIESRDQFTRAVEAAQAKTAACRREVWVCCGTGCLANGSAEVAEAFSAAIAAGAGVSLSLFTKKTGCHGFCEQGPVMMLDWEIIGNLEPEKIDRALEAARTRSKKDSD